MVINIATAAPHNTAMYWSNIQRGEDLYNYNWMIPRQHPVPTEEHQTQLTTMPAPANQQTRQLSTPDYFVCANPLSPQPPHTRTCLDTTSPLSVTHLQV